MKVVVTGAAGFIGSNLVDTLLANGHFVVALDDVSTGRHEFLESARGHDRFEFFELDLLASDQLEAKLVQADAVVHLAANADVRFGWDHPRLDYEQNVVVTQRVLESMRAVGVRRFLFSSTGSVYGECPIIPTPEDAPFPIQNSLYGASKLAAEAMIQAYAEAGHVSATIFRFVSILGPRYTHGHVFDFVQQLRENPRALTILGDGTQRKSYLHVDDCVRAIVHELPTNPGLDVFNLGCDEELTVRESAARICLRLGLDPVLQFTGGDRGWIGDSPRIYLDTSRIRARGWEPTTSILRAVDDTVTWLNDNSWVFDAGQKETT